MPIVQFSPRRSSSSGPAFEETLSHAEAVDVFVHNGEDAYGFPPYPTLAPSLSKWNDEDLHLREDCYHL